MLLLINSNVLWNFLQKVISPSGSHISFWFLMLVLISPSGSHISFWFRMQLQHSLYTNNFFYTSVTCCIPVWLVLYQCDLFYTSVACCIPVWFVVYQCDLLYTSVTCCIPVWLVLSNISTINIIYGMCDIPVLLCY